MMGKKGSGDLGLHLERKDGAGGCIVMRFTVRHATDPNQVGTRLKVYLKTRDASEAQARRDIVLQAFHLAGLLSTARLEVGDFVDLSGETGGRSEHFGIPGDFGTLASDMPTPSNEAPTAAGEPVQAEVPALSIEDRLARLEAVHAAEVARLNGVVGRMEIQIWKLRQASR